MRAAASEVRVRWTILALIAITAAGATLRLLMAGFHNDLNQDAAYLFLPCAQRIAAGDWLHGLDHSVPTGFLVLHGLWLRLHGGDPEFGARLLTAALGTSCIPATWLLARAFLKAVPALLAAALVAINPMSVQFSGRISSEIPYAFFLTLALWAGVHALRNRRALVAAATGLASGAACLIRPEAMAVLPVVGAGLLRFDFPRGRWRGTVLPLALFLATFFAMATPMIWVNYRATGRISLSNKGGISLLRYTDDESPLALTEDHHSTRIRHFLSRDGYRSFDPYARIIAKPLSFLRDYAENLWLFAGRFLPRTASIAIGLGVLLTLFRWRSLVRRSEITGDLLPYLGSFTLLYLAALALFFPSRRFVLPLAPILAVLGAPGLVFSAARLGARVPRLGILVLVLLLGGDLIMAVHKLDKYGGGWRDNPDRTIGEEISARYHAHRILSPGGEIAYYAGAQPVIFPDDTYTAILDYARYQKVDLIVLPRGAVPTWPDKPAGLEELPPVRVTTRTGVREARIWRVLPPSF